MNNHILVPLTEPRLRHLCANMHGVLYRAVNQENGKPYCGITLDLHQRVRSHLASASLDANPNSLAFAIALYGRNKFRFETLTNAPVLELPDLERQAIAYHESLAPRGYNLNRGGTFHFRGGYVIEYCGDEFVSLADLARRFDIPGPTVYYRNRARWSDAQLVGHEPRPHFRAKSVQHPDGRVFLSGRQAAAATGRSPDCIQYWRKRGRPDSEILGIEAVPAKHGRRQRVSVHGVTFDRFDLACVALGLDARQVSHRKWRENKARSIAGLPTLDSGQVLEMLVDTKGTRRPHARARLIEVPGGQHLTVAAAATTYGINYKKLASRIARHWPVERALDLALP